MSQRIRTFFKIFEGEPIFAASVLVLLMLAALGVVMNLAVNFHPREVEVVGGSQTAELQNQRIRIGFNRPLKNQDLSSLVAIEPEVEKETVVSGANLFVYFPRPLQADQSYKLFLDENIQDYYGEALGETEPLEFRTRTQELFFVERPAYGSSISGDDMWKLATWSPEDNDTKVVTFSKLPILNYAVNKDYAAMVVEQTEFLNQLVVVDRRDGKSKTVTEVGQESVYHVQFVPGRNQVLVNKEKVRYEDEYVVSDGGRALFIYDIDAATWRQIELELDIEDIDVFNVSADGRAVLVRDSTNAQYYLVDVASPDRTFPLGRFVGGGGISVDNEYVIFSELDPLSNRAFPFVVQVDADGNKQMLSVPDRYAIDPVFFNGDRTALWAEKYRDAAQTQGLFELVQYSEGKLVSKYRIPGDSLELPAISADDRYIAAERYSLDDLRSLEGIRVFGFQSKPARADLYIFEVGKSEPIFWLAGSLQPTWY